MYDFFNCLYDLEFIDVKGTSRLDSVERYDPETNSWADVPPLKMAVTSPAVVAYDGALYVTGGAILEDGDGIELVQKYDTKTGAWTEVAGTFLFSLSDRPH